MKKPLLVIAGPTASGKTDTAVAVAQALNGAVLSADSMQVYQEMNIGTAKPTLEERGGINHYLLDEWPPSVSCNAKMFQERAKEYLEEIYAQGKLPIVAGGTGFYIQALVYDNDFAPTEEKGESERAQAILEAEGPEGLHRALSQVDPEYAAQIHANNVKRVLRALTYYYQTGEKMSAHNEEAREKSSPYDLLFVVLSMEREVLYDRINRRVDLMMEAGLLEEVEGLLKKGYDPSLTSMQGLGYKEFIPYFRGECTLEEAVEQLKQSTRRFAKRQLTWFRRQQNAHWVDMTGKTAQEAAQEIITLWNNR